MADGAPLVRFRGSRGSRPVSESSHVRYGGNTSCVELPPVGRERIVLDAGTGITGLGREMGEDIDRIHIFLSHFHWDHIQGLPFLGPLYRPGMQLFFYAAVPATEIEARLAGQMTLPYFPVNFRAVGSSVKFVEIKDEPVQVAGMWVRAFPLNHPGGSSGYQVTLGEHVVVYATDHEIGDAALDEVLLRHAEGARLLILDAQYTTEEAAVWKGRGHSAWEDAVRVAGEARVGELVLFHHDPEHDDEAMAQIEGAAQASLAGTSAARDGRVIELRGEGGVGLSRVAGLNA